jgi:hypothetical protein
MNALTVAVGFVDVTLVVALRVVWWRMQLLNTRVRDQNERAGTQALELQATREELATADAEVCRLMAVNDTLYRQLHGRAS